MTDIFFSFQSLPAKRLQAGVIHKIPMMLCALYYCTECANFLKKHLI
ncbi:hypothetical protein J569_0301 [Acinetobacter sp. 907131]|nr:hypothetical protein J536_1087 [Acinetobacter sp. 809848]EXE28342.1 hypothetical protein J569_0301 [Acinetobacter sp. 907131]EXS17401.1 hypothetical protein J672_1167 [Acinetobacter sp. 883425]